MLALLMVSPGWVAAVSSEPEPVGAASAALLQGTDGVAPGKPGASHEETQLERDTRMISSQLRCPVCQGLSLQDSPSPLAQEMRAVVTEQLRAGKTPAEVKQYFVDKYGEWILLEPEASGFNLVVYVVPVLLLLGGALFVYRTARKWTQHRPGDDAAAPVDESVHAG
jgi:cytochrome c-type biogenesis protein CcmH